MTDQRHHITRLSRTTLKAVGILVFLSFLCLSSFGQNTKGDRPQGNAKGPKRESRFRLPFKKKGKKAQEVSYKRAQPRNDSRVGAARQPSRKSSNVFPQNGRYVSKNPSDRQRAGNGGRRVSVRSNTGKTRNVFPQYRRYVVKNPTDKQKPWRGDITGRRVPARRKESEAKRESGKNIYPQHGPWVNNPSRKPRSSQQPVSNRRTLARLNQLQGNPHAEPPPGKKKKVIPRSASHSFIRHKSINVYANFPRPKKKPERAVTKDLAGRKLRTKNYETPRPKILPPTFKPYRGRKRVGDRPYRGPAAGGYQSATRTTQRAWTGDIAGRKIRGRNFSSKPKLEAGRPVFPPRRLHDHYGDRPYRGRSGGFSTASKPGEKRPGISPLPARVPGIGAQGIGGFRGRIKGGRPIKGGGSISGRTWNNKRSPLPVRPPGTGRLAAGFPGRLRRFEASPGFGDQGEGFTGVIKRGRPAKGGGSISGRTWNNKGVPVPVRTPGGQSARAVGYSGNIKGGKPLKGGGSVSGRSWNNRGNAIPVRGPSGQTMRAGLFSGNIKTGRPAKGGGSVSGRLWNNKQSPIPVRTPPAGAEQVGGYPGKIKRFSLTPGFNDQGEEFTGYIRRPRLWKDYIRNDNSAKAALKKKRPTTATFRTGELQVRVRQRKYQQNDNASENSILKKSPTQSTYQTGDLQVKVRERKYVQNKNASENSILKKSPTRATYQTGDLQVKMKQSKYVQNKNASEESILKKAPTKGTFQTGELQVRVKQKPYGRKPNAAEGALAGVKPTKTSIKASEFSKSVKRNWDYIHNPSSADEALKVHEPGKAFARSTDYQGNIKMKKFTLFEKDRRLHPDAKFVKINKNNVDSERDMMTNLKLWWARLFKKQEAQPEHLKEKGKKPRYDKGEAGLWYD